MKIKTIIVSVLASLFIGLAGCYDIDYPAPYYGGGRTVYKNVYRDNDGDYYHGRTVYKNVYKDYDHHGERHEHEGHRNRH